MKVTNNTNHTAKPVKGKWETVKKKLCISGDQSNAISPHVNKRKLNAYALI